MKPPVPLRHWLLAATTTLLIAGHASALRDSDNQGRWEEPNQRGPDAEVPGFLVNMGPTGARGVLKERSFVIKHIFADSPADGVLKLGDEVTGANGTPFSAHQFGPRNHGICGPMRDLGLAIEDSEGEDGLLRLSVTRDGEPVTADVQLEALGRFADTFPHDCAKTRVLRDRAYQYLIDNPGGLNSHARCVAALALMGADNPEFAAAGKQMALDWNEPYQDTTWSWHLAFQAITLAEYHLLAGDDAVLETLEHTLGLLRNAQWTGEIRHWPLSHFSDDVDEETLNKHQQRYVGGFGHSPYHHVVARGGGGYGPMQWPTCIAIMSWQLAKQCGIEPEHNGLDEAFQFLEYGTTKGGRIAYGGEFTLNRGPIDTEEWQQDTRHSFSHKSGLGYITYMLSPERPNAEERKKLHLTNIANAYRDMADGHACAMMGFAWGLAGTFASDDEELQKQVFDYYKAWINLARCHGSDSYVILPSRDYSDYSYYRDNIRNSMTAAIALLYSYSSPKLRVHGVE